MARVVVVGGGYGGASLARQLDADLDVVLVEPKDAFVHSSAALRAVVDATWQDRVFFPYDRLLTRGHVVQDWARRVSPRRVTISPFESIDADYLVLATGTSYPFPAKFLEDETEVAIARLGRLREALARTERVLLVGGGPVGLELAGELTAAFPHLHVTIVDRADDILTVGDYLPELREAVRSQLAARGVEFLTGAPLAYPPPVDVGIHHPFTVETTTRVPIEAQMWFRCFGARPMTDYLDEDLAAARRPDGRLRVTDTLNVVGQDRVFAIGDITDLPESKRASVAATTRRWWRRTSGTWSTADARRRGTPRHPSGSCCRWARTAVPRRWSGTAAGAWSWGRRRRPGSRVPTCSARRSRRCSGESDASRARAHRSLDAARIDDDP